MTFAGINYLAVLIAAATGFLFGSIWYGLLGKAWMAALGLSEPPKPAPAPFIIAFACQLVMSWIFAGLVGHLGEVSLGTSLFSALLVWVGFVLTTQMVNHRFQAASWSLTAIDAGHWLGVLLVMASIIGFFGL